jgi:hypothetical protein
MDTIKVAFDMFPAEVKDDQGNITKTARAVVIDGKLLVWVVKDGKPYQMVSAPVVSTEGAVGRLLKVQTDNGIYELSRGGGCGCGNPLKSYNPWPGKRRIPVGLDG